MSRGHHGRCPDCGTKLQRGRTGLICPTTVKDMPRHDLGAPVWPFTARYFGLKKGKS